MELFPYMTFLDISSTLLKYKMTFHQ